MTDGTDISTGKAQTMEQEHKEQQARKPYTSPELDRQQKLVEITEGEEPLAT